LKLASSPSVAGQRLTESSSRDCRQDRPTSRRDWSRGNPSQSRTSRLPPSRVITRDLERAAAETRDTASHCLELELARLDEIERGLWARADAGHLGAVDRLLKVSERRSRLLGLEAPQRHTLEARVDVLAQLGVDAAELGRLHQAWLDSFGPATAGEALELPSASDDRHAGDD
jgi:hypothetical protein